MAGEGGKQEEKLPRVREAADGTAVVEDFDEIAGQGTPSGEEDERLVDDPGRVTEDEEELDEEEPGRTEVNPNETDEERRERRRLEKQERKERQKRARERKDRELNDLRSLVHELSGRVAQHEQRSTAGDMARLESAITEATEQAEAYRQAIADAMKAQDGDALAKAQGNWYQWTRRAESLQATKQRVVEGQRQSAQRQQRPTIDPAAQALARRWMQSNSWYDPQGGDEDSDIVLTIDARLVREGFDPKTQEYWDELTDRVKRRLPNHFRKAKVRDDNGGERGAENEGGERGNGRRQTTTGSGREASPPGVRRGFVLSKDRVDAMKEAGIWDDPVKRAKQIQAYRKYDEIQRQAGRS